MENNNWAAIVLIINLVLTATIPLATAWLNNRHQEKLSKMELFEKRKLDAFEEYLNQAGAETGKDRANASHSLRQAHAKAYMYADEETRKLMDQFFETASRSGPFSAPKLLDQIASNFQSLINNPK